LADLYLAVLKAAGTLVHVQNSTGSVLLCLDKPEGERDRAFSPRRRQGSITKAGNSSARRAMIEAAQAYAHPARLSWVIARRQTHASKRACDIAWKAQLRLCGRFRRLAARRLPRNKVIVAIARELAGLVWAIARDVKPIA
jgi:hypothetical protein